MSFIQIFLSQVQYMSGFVWVFRNILAAQTDQAAWHPVERAPSIHLDSINKKPSGGCTSKYWVEKPWLKCDYESEVDIAMHRPIHCQKYYFLIIHSINVKQESLTKLHLESENAQTSVGCRCRSSISQSHQTQGTHGLQQLPLDIPSGEWMSPISTMILVGR